MLGLKPYDFSFTGTSLRVLDMAKLAEAMLLGGELNHIEVLGRGKSGTGIKHNREIRKRLIQLTPEQLRLLVEGDFDSQRQIALLAMCKAHTFIRDFVVEVLREKMLVFDLEFSEGDYIAFIRRKLEEHPEIDELKEVTQRKIKQVTFKILEQGGLIDDVDSKRIQPQFPVNSVIKAVAADDPQWLKIFLMSDDDMANLVHVA